MFLGLTIEKLVRQIVLVLRGIYYSYNEKNIAVTGGMFESWRNWAHCGLASVELMHLGVLIPQPLIWNTAVLSFSHECHFLCTLRENSLMTENLTSLDIKSLIKKKQKEKEHPETQKSELELSTLLVFY